MDLGLLGKRIATRTTKLPGGYLLDTVDAGILR